MRRLLWVLKKNPVYAEKHNGYPELRFYTETILALAVAGGFDSVDFVYLDMRPGTLDQRNPRGDLERLMCLRSRFQESRPIDVTLRHVTEVDPSERFDLGVMSIIAHVAPSWLKEAVTPLAWLAGQCDGYIYGDSDLELDPGQTITPKATTFLRWLAKNPDHVLRRKLKATFITEYPEGYKKQSSQSLMADAVYLPRLGLPIEVEPRQEPIIRLRDEVNRVYDLTFLKYYRGWWDRWIRDLYTSRPHTLTRYYVSPHPATYRADVTAIVDDLGDRAEVLRARMWTYDQILSTYWKTKFVPAAGRPINRLTSKLYEGLSAGACVLMPWLRYDEEDGYYSEVFHAYASFGPAVDYTQNWLRLGVWKPYLDNWDQFRALRRGQTQFHNQLCGIAENADRVRHLLDIALN